MLQVRLQTRVGKTAIDVAFETHPTGITVMFGPSGAGKSTIIAMIAGTMTPKKGRIALGDTVFFDDEQGIDLPPERRNLGFVHQDALLFPHMPVIDNLRYGLKRTKRAIRIRLDDVTNILQIGHLLARQPRFLSGGERQRVALGRAVLGQPDFLLLDEPVSALDPDLRAETLSFVRKLNLHYRLPMLLVTHGVQEGYRLADGMIRIKDGRVSQPLPRHTDGVTTGVIARQEAMCTFVRIGDSEYRLPRLSGEAGDIVRIVSS